MSRSRSAIRVATSVLALVVSGISGCAGGGGATAPILPDLPRATPLTPASGAFRGLWYDGNAELSGYRLTTPRYGELRSGELALVYVTEPLDRRTWIKDDDAPASARVDAMKLIQSFGFLTGIYPYAVTTTTMAPIDDWGGERFAPVKISLGAQEWCGHVFHAVWPGTGRLRNHIASYFASEGERVTDVPMPEGDLLYEDALLIQLRELDGPFAGGGDWAGHLVPSLWRLRRAHELPAAVAATITRSVAEFDGTRLTRFVMTAGEYVRTFDIELASPRRVLGWTTSDGEIARLVGTTRRPYWTLNRSGDEALRAELGLSTGPAPRPEAPPGTTRIGR